MSYENPWIHNGVPLESEHIQPYQGMVYLIENQVNGKSYVGKKFFWSKKVKTVNKKRKKVLVESDWKSYYGSSNTLKADIEKHGHLQMRRSVLQLCETKTQCAYYEMKEQIERNVLLREDYYNEFIGGKINGRFLKEVKNGDIDL